MKPDNTEALNPTFKDQPFIEATIPKATITAHHQIFKKLLAQVENVDFRVLADLKEGDKLTNAHYRITIAEHLKKLAEKNHWGLCRNQDFIYAYNSFFWSLIDSDEMKSFLGEAAEKMGLPWEKAKDYKFRDELFKQFLQTAHPPRQQKKDIVVIPLLNGTFEIQNSLKKLRAFDRDDFITYQLNFEYNPNAVCPIFDKYLSEVLPDGSSRQVLAEFLGWVFTTGIKLEKTLLLCGPGANGKSVFFEVVSALLGPDNISSYSLHSLTNDTGYYRAMLANKLVNYASEINGNLEASLFKQLVSGEPVEARLPYGQPMIIHDYAKLVFNTNQLPHDVEHSNAFFRRFLIIPFNVIIPNDKQDIGLARKIIDNELSGVFNWALSGLDRILVNRKFTECKAAREALDQYRKESDSVAMFIDENDYIPSEEKEYEPLKDLYDRYRGYCSDDGYRPVSKQNFRKRLQMVFGTGVVNRITIGNVVYLSRKKPVSATSPTMSL
jgi:putative DNA primase/helicase